MGHEAGVTGTASRIPLRNDSQCEEGVHTHIDSTNPFRFLVGAKRPPFFPYHWGCTGPLVLRTRYAHSRPNNDQSDGEDTRDLHIWTRGRAYEGKDAGLFIALTR